VHRYRLALIGTIASCGGVHPPKQAAGEDRVAIVASERGPNGVRLVAIDERGDRRFELVQAVAGTTLVTRDANPAISPDGRWVVFASTRDRADGTSLWIAPLAAEAVPRRLTDDAAIDAHPAWRPDGTAIVFASTRGGDFDLWELAIDRGQARGAPVQLVSGPGHQVTPSVAPDGTIAYGVVTPTSATEVESHLEERAPDGTTRRLTDGPGDASPAYSPDGSTIAFTRPVTRETAVDADLFTLERSSGRIAQVIDLPLTNEGGPVWSRDGRFLFATSVLKAPESGAVFSSVVHVDLQEPARKARILEDSAGANVRLTPAIPTRALDVAALHADPEYLPELARIMARAIAERTKK
jgi:Tol biopolymer transport system component